LYNCGAVLPSSRANSDMLCLSQLNCTAFSLKTRSEILRVCFIGYELSLLFLTSYAG
jgi:hypothetical protein